MNDWRRALVIPRSLLTAIIALVALLVPVAYLAYFRASIDQITPANAQALAKEVPRTQRNIDFGGMFVLVGAEMRPTAEGVELELVWQSENSERLDYEVAVHIVDSSGAIVSNLDYPQDPAEPWVGSGEFWRDVVRLPADKLEGSSAVAIGLYRAPEGLVHISRGQRDWDNHRLLIPLGSAAESSLPPSPDREAG